MTTGQLLESIHDRGLRVLVRPDGGLVLAGPREEVTPALIDVCNISPHRETLAEWARTFGEVLCAKCQRPPDLCECLGTQDGQGDRYNSGGI